MKLLIKSLLCYAVLAAGVAQAGEAPAVDRTEYFNAPAHCQGALPNFEGALRKRPLALQNEGASNTFVTCAIPTQGRVQALEMYVDSPGGTAAPVTCTAVTGYTGGDNVYVPRTVMTNPGGFAGIVWTASDFDEALEFPSEFIALSCNLAPGTSLNDFWLHYSETVG